MEGRRKRSSIKVVSNSVTPSSLSLAEVKIRSYQPAPNKASRGGHFGAIVAERRIARLIRGVKARGLDGRHSRRCSPGPALGRMLIFSRCRARGGTVRDVDEAAVGSVGGAAKGENVG